MIGVRLLEALRRIGTHETHLIVSASGAVTAAQELGVGRTDLDTLADVVHNVRDVGATVASGSFVTSGMVDRALLNENARCRGKRFLRQSPHARG
jgi:2,5-furandicarboxylate decarboxylase 2